MICGHLNTNSWQLITLPISEPSRHTGYPPAWAIPCPVGASRWRVPHVLWVPLEGTPCVRIAPRLVMLLNVHISFTRGSTNAQDDAHKTHGVPSSGAHKTRGTLQRPPKQSSHASKTHFFKNIRVLFNLSCFVQFEACWVYPLVS